MIELVEKNKAVVTVAFKSHGKNDTISGATKDPVSNDAGGVNRLTLGQEVKPSDGSRRISVALECEAETAKGGGTICSEVNQSCHRTLDKGTAAPRRVMVGARAVRSLDRPAERVGDGAVVLQVILIDPTSFARQVLNRRIIHHIDVERAGNEVAVEICDSIGETKPQQIIQVILRAILARVWMIELANQLEREVAGDPVVDRQLEDDIAVSVASLEGEEVQDAAVARGGKARDGDRAAAGGEARQDLRAGTLLIHIARADEADPRDRSEIRTLLEGQPA